MSEIIKVDDTALDQLIDKITEATEAEYKQFKKKAKKKIKEYVMSNNLIVTGKYAIRKLLKMAEISPSDAKNLPHISEDDNYIQCYTTYGMKNIGDLIKLFKSLDYPFIRSETRHVWYGVKCTIKAGQLKGGLKMIEVINIDKFAYNALKTTMKVKKYGDKDLKIVSPLLMKEYIFQVLSDPFSEFNDWKIMYNYKVYFDKYYNEANILRGWNSNIESREEHDPDIAKILKSIQKSLFTNKEVIFISDYAYNKYLETSGLKRNSIGIHNYTVIAADPKSVANEVIKNLGQKIEVKEYKNIINYVNNKVVLKYKGRILLNIYNIEDSCVPYMNYKTEFGDIKIANFYVVLKFYFAVLWENLLSQQGNQRNRRYIEQLGGIIKNLIECREYYLLRNNKLGIEGEKNIFRVFNISCYRNDDAFSEIYQHGMKIWEYKKKHGSKEYEKIKGRCLPLE